MDFNEAKNIEESAKKKPIKTILVVLISLAMVALIAYTQGFFGEKGKDHADTSTEPAKVSDQGNKTVQITKGNQSPAVVSDGDVSIYYGKDLPKEVTELLIQLYQNLKGRDEELDKEYEEYRKVEIEKTKKKLLSIYGNQQSDISKKAQQEAVEFFASLPDRKQKALDNIEQQKRKAAEARIKLPILVNYILTEFDSMINSYQIIDKGIKLTNYTVPDLVVEAANERSSYPLRKVDFPNGCSISITVKTGNISNDIIRSLPEIRVSEKASIPHNWRLYYFDIGQNPPTLGGNYYTYDLPDKRFLDDSFKRNISQLFKKIIQTTYSRNIENINIPDFDNELN